MLLLAFGQKKMVNKPIVGILHLVVYVGFILINIELLEKKIKLTDKNMTRSNISLDQAIELVLYA